MCVCLGVGEDPKKFESCLCIISPSIPSDVVISAQALIYVYVNLARGGAMHAVKIEKQ